MFNPPNFKIVGSGPTGVLLAIALSNLKLNIFLTDLLSREMLINKDKTYAITHSTRKILEKFSLWRKLKPYLFGFDTLSITDQVTSSFTNLTISDLDQDIVSENNIGWVIKHSDLMKVFFDTIDLHDNIIFKQQGKQSNENKFFDFQFISTGANTSKKRTLNIFDIKKEYNQACLTFKVLVRGNFKRRAYEIFRDEGPLALLPLDVNLYQVIWTSNTSKSKDRLNSDKNFLMDNLSTILPVNFKLDQIVGEINVFPVSLSWNMPIFSSRDALLVGDSFHTFHPVGGQGLNTCWRDVNTIFDLLSKTHSITKKNLNIFKFKYYFSRILDVTTTIIVTDFLIRLFANKNFFLFPVRKISFFLLNNFFVIRKIVLNQMTKSLIFSSIK